MSCEHLSNHSLIADDKIIKNLVRSPWNTILLIFPLECGPEPRQRLALVMSNKIQALVGWAQF